MKLILYTWLAVLWLASCVIVVFGIGLIVNGYFLGALLLVIVGLACHSMYRLPATIERMFALCRYCNKHSVPLSDMAIYSYKSSYGGFTGVCKRCMANERRLEEYIKRST